MRLVTLVGPCIGKVSEDTGKQILFKINKIIRSGALELIQINWIDESIKNGHFKKLTTFEQNEYLDSLYEFSKANYNPIISEKAQALYNSYKKDKNI